MLDDKALDWGKLTPLKFRARTIADGVYAGNHRSTRRGTGIEFGGHRNYMPGDDLRFIDRRALMRHGKLLIRLFETETERSLNLIVDATRSMAFRSEGAPGAKLAYAALIAAALARVALRGGDLVSLDWVGGQECRPFPGSGGRTAFDRLVEVLESARNGQAELVTGEEVERTMAIVDRRTKRGSVVVLFSDFLDLPEHAVEAYAALASRGRTLLAVRVLDPIEKTFPFSGPLRLKASEQSVVIETDAGGARADYLKALAAQAEVWKSRLLPLGGQLVDVATTDDPVEVVRNVLSAAEGRLP